MRWKTSCAKPSSEWDAKAMDERPDLDLTADERLIESEVVSPEDREFDVALRDRKSVV